MSFLNHHKKLLSLILFITFTGMSLGISPAYAKMIPTSKILKPSQISSEREKLNIFMEREDVQKQLALWGLSKDAAKAQLDSMTDEEVSLIAGKLGHLPAGGDGLGILVGAALLVFFVLLLTDILGYTDVFPFTR